MKVRYALLNLFQEIDGLRVVFDSIAWLLLCLIAFLVYALYNPGQGDLVVSSFTQPAPPFNLSGSTCGMLPFTLTAGNNCALIYTFEPDKANTFNQLIKIISNAPASSDLW